MPTRMARCVIGLALCWVARIGAAGAEEVALDCGFSPAELAAWEPGGLGRAEAADGGDGFVLRVEVPPGTPNGVVTLPFDVSRHAGRFVVLSCRVKYRGVTKPKESYNGVKCMLSFPRGNGTSRYIHPRGRHGDADWTELRCSAFIDTDAKPGRLSLGLQDASGTVWFDRLRLVVLDETELYPPLAPADHRPVYTEALRSAPPRRGVMMSPVFTENTLTRDLPDLKKWKVNLVRWQLMRNWSAVNANQDVDEYLAWIDARIPEVKQVLDKAGELGMKVALDLHVPPGGNNASGEMNMFHQRHFANAFVEAWRRLATACKGHPALYGYDLINEPTQNAGAPINYLELQYEAAKTVRAIDPDTPIIVESNMAATARTFAYLAPLPMDNVIYQAHMYEPIGFTHQGVNGAPMRGAYPGEFHGQAFDREALRRALRPVRDFQLKHGTKIFIGEFSAVRWAPGAERYLDDVIGIFEEYGWDWSYHAFREWEGWSVEHNETATDREPSAQDGERKKTLLKYFARNNGGRGDAQP